MTAEEQWQFQAELSAVEPEEREEVMQIVTSWMEEGLLQGRQQGLEQGRQQGLEQGRQQGLAQGRQQEALSLIMRQLNRRVGTLPPDLEERLSALPIAGLEALGEALLDFSEISDVEAWLAESNR